MTILVTGATGTVGRHVAEQLVRRGLPTRALSRNPAQARLPEGLDVAAGNLNVPETIRDALQGVTSLYLILSSDNANADLQTDLKIVEMAEEAGVRRIVALLDYEGNPIEQALKQSGLEWTLLKPVEFMANALADWRESIRTEGVVREPFGHALSARVHEADIAAVAVEALTGDGHHGQSYYITGPEALSRVDAVNMIAEAIGKEIRFEEWTEEQARSRWKEQGYGEADIEFFVAMGKNPPEIGYSVLPTVERVTGRPAKTFAEWAAEHKRDFM
ncbi:SDR family oxidoreductase [Paenibacillus flagellatus]|uniref:Hydroxylase n=1 Tax=Paenibacillus flagellatus TaxID=2211139 RepID=A0A2V5KXV4_9BACL|nr:NAD(P)H-binding protein [Paenibacillus flagellatus]PYI57367.1 hydroxylase [Paenibacillus flagellatus]